MIIVKGFPLQFFFFLQNCIKYIEGLFYIIDMKQILSIRKGVSFINFMEYKNIQNNNIKR